MGSFAVLSTAVGGATAFASDLGTVSAAIAIALFVFFAGLSIIFSAPAYQVAILAATACVVMVDHPAFRAGDGFHFLFIYLTGCCFALLLSFTVWRIHPFAPARLATKIVYGRLAELARGNARLLAAANFDAEKWARCTAEKRMLVRNAIESARKSLVRIPRSKSDGRQLFSDLSFAIEDAEGIFEYLLAVSHMTEQSSLAQLNRDRSARVLTAMSDLLGRIGDVLSEPPVAYPVPLRRRLSRLSAYLKEPAMGRLSFERPPVDTGTIAHTVKNGGSWLGAGVHVVREALQKLQRNLTADSSGVRHAIRLATATTGAFLVIRILHLPYGYWATMATLLVMQPSVGTTWPRGIERAVGSTVGAAIAIVIGYVASTRWELSLAVFPLTCLAMSMRKVSYGLFVVFLTPAFVLVADLASPDTGLFNSLARLGDNVLGVVLAVLASTLLWPKRSTNELDIAVTDAVRANMKYLVMCLQGAGASDAECEQARRGAGLSSNVLEQVYKLARFEQWSFAKRVNDVEKVSSILRSMAGAASRFRVAMPGRAPDQQLVLWILAAAENAGTAGQSISLPLAPSILRSVQLSALELNVVHQMKRLDDLLARLSFVQ
ncbi:FUSC family protein [Paraburkholderia guartelaensis]|nr:FUSC family protein [Paraburkholderia guartelaensis]